MSNKLASLVIKYRHSQKTKSHSNGHNQHLERSVQQQSLALPQKQRLKMIEELSMAKRLYKDHGLMSEKNYQQTLNRKKIEISQKLIDKDNKSNK